jgi:hypothetical protein
VPKPLGYASMSVNVDINRRFVTGATGFEPASSDVTGPRFSQFKLHPFMIANISLHLELLCTSLLNLLLS